MEKTITFSGFIRCKNNSLPHECFFAYKDETDLGGWIIYLSKNKDYSDIKVIPKKFTVTGTAYETKRFYLHRKSLSPIPENEYNSNIDGWTIIYFN